MIPRRPASPPPRGTFTFSGFSPPLLVVGFIATRRGDAERGPMVRMRPEEALIRLLDDGELVRIVGPRRTEFAELRIDESVPKGGVVVRDIVGVAPSEIVRVIKPDLEPRGPAADGSATA